MLHRGQEGGGGLRTCANMQVCARVCSLSSEAVGVRMGGRIYRCLLLSSLFIQLQISEHTHYLPFMGWQVLVKITIFRMDRLELSLLPRYPVSPRLFPMYIYKYRRHGVWCVLSKQIRVSSQFLCSVARCVCGIDLRNSFE